MISFADKNLSMKENSFGCAVELLLEFLKYNFHTTPTGIKSALKIFTILYNSDCEELNSATFEMTIRMTCMFMKRKSLIWRDPYTGEIIT